VLSLGQGLHIGLVNKEPGSPSEHSRSAAAEQRPPSVRTPPASTFQLRPGAAASGVASLGAVSCLAAAL
jgi:hypothetical protein